MSDTTDMTPSAFSRLERKMDLLTDAVSKLILIEERQMIQALRIAEIEARIRTADCERRAISDKLEMWINRGIGVGTLSAVLFAVMGLAIKFVN